MIFIIFVRCTKRPLFQGSMARGSKLEEPMVALWYSEFIIVVIVHSWNVIKYLPDKNTKLVYNIVESTIGKVGVTTVNTHFEIAFEFNEMST